jgi:hypothetical protein
MESVYRDIALRDYDASLQTSKSLTPSVYEAVGDIFRHRFGARAGWAHSVLFAAELPEFRVLLPPELKNDMAAYSAQRKVQSAEKRRAKALGGKRKTIAADSDDDGDGLVFEITPQKDRSHPS